MIEPMGYLLCHAIFTLCLILTALPASWSRANDGLDDADVVKGRPLQGLVTSTDTATETHSPGNDYSLEMAMNYQNLTTTSTLLTRQNTSFEENMLADDSSEYDNVNSEIHCNFSWTDIDTSTDDDTGKKFISDIRYITLGIIQPTIAFPGCICNIINIYVLSKQQKPSANTKILIGLSVADLAFLCVVLMQWCEYLIETFNYPLYALIVTRIRVYWLWSVAELGTGRTSNALIVVLSLERFIAVRFPFAAKTSPITRHPIKTVVAVFVFVFATLMPNLFRQEYVEVFDPVTNQSLVINTLTHFAKTNPEFYTVFTYATLILLRLLPVSLVIVLNVAIIITLKTSRMSERTNQISDKRQLREVKITRMLIAISFIFLFCVFPGLVHFLLGNFLPGYTRWGDKKEEWITVFYIYTVFDTINSTVNFFVYVFTSDNFRDTFIDLLHCRRSPIKSPASDVVASENSRSVTQATK